MRRIVLDMKGGLLAEAVMQSLSGCDPDFLVYRSSKPEETLALCRNCRANVLVMEVIRQGIWKLSERLRLCSAVRQLGWDCKVLLLVDGSAGRQFYLCVGIADLPGRRDRYALEGSDLFAGRDTEKSGEFAGI